MPFSVAPLLKQQSQSPSYGHGWIMGNDGTRWHPSNNQQQLLRALSTKRPGMIGRLKSFIGGWYE